MAIADQLGTTITTGDRVAVAVADGVVSHLIIGAISGALQNDRGQNYFDVVRADRSGNPFARAVVTYNAAYPNGICLNAVKAGFT